MLLPLQPCAAAAERFPRLTVGTVTVGEEDFLELFGPDARPDSLSLRLFEEYALRLAAAAEAGSDLHLSDRSADAVIARQMAVMSTESHALDSLAAADTITPERMFELCRDSLRWEAPRFKGSIVLALDDSLARSATAMLREMGRAGATERRAEVMRRFGKRVRLVDLLVERGANSWADHAVWGDPLPSSTTLEPWRAARKVDGRILDQPEEPADAADRLTMLHRDRQQRRRLADLRCRFKITYHHLPR